MPEGFQFYEGNATDSATVAQITVRKGGVLVLTKAAVKMLGDDVDAVQVGYNPTNRAVALRSATAGSKGAYRLRSQRNSVSRLVDGKRIFKHHGLVADASANYEAEDFGDGLVGFILPESASDREAEIEEPAPAPKTKPRRRPPKK